MPGLPSIDSIRSPFVRKFTKNLKNQKIKIKLLKAANVLDSLLGGSFFFFCVNDPR